MANAGDPNYVNPNPTRQMLRDSGNAALTNAGQAPIPAPAINLSPPGQRGAVASLGAANFTKGQPSTPPAGPVAAAPNTDPIASIANRQPSATHAPADNSTYLSRNFPSLTANSQANTDLARKQAPLGETMGNQVRAAGNTLADVGSDLMQPAIGIGGAIANTAKGFAQGLTGTASAASSAPASATAPAVSASAVPAPAAAAVAPVTTTPGTAAPAPDFNTAPTSIAGISKVTGKGIKSPIFTNLDPAQAASDYRTNQPNIVPTPQGIGGAAQGNGINFGSGGGQSGGSAALSATRAAAADRGDFDSVAATYQKGGGEFNGQTAQDVSNENSMRILTNAIGQAHGKQKTNLLAQQAGLINAQTQGKSAIAEAGLKSAQTGLSQANTAAKNQETEMSNANHVQIMKLQDLFVSEADPARQRRIGNQILTLLGHNPKQDVVQIATQDELVDPSNPAFGVKKTPYVINNVTGAVQRVTEASDAGGMGKKTGASGAVPTPANVARLKIYPNEAALFDKQFGAGAAAKILGK